ncbi:putative nuclease HARBI1 [Tautogolabrus adspersus]
MAHRFESWDNLEDEDDRRVLPAVLRRQRVLRDRLNPLEMYDDFDLFSRFRFPRAKIQRITDLLATDLRHETDRNGALSRLLQVCLALRYFATGSFQNLVGDSGRVHESTVCRAVRAVAVSLCGHFNQQVRFPSAEQQSITRQKLYQTAGFPDLLGCVDGAHFKIKRPSRNENDLVNRKGYHSINAQIVCDADLVITNAVIKWPGAKHDSYILKQCILWRDFEAGKYPGRLLGDSGYPLKMWLMTPYLNPTTPIGILMEPDRAAAVAGACAVLHILAMTWKVPLVEEGQADEGNVGIPFGNEELIPAEAATVRAYLTAYYFG